MVSGRYCVFSINLNVTMLLSTVCRSCYVSSYYLRHYSTPPRIYTREYLIQVVTTPHSPGLR